MNWFIADTHLDHVLVGPRGNRFPTINDWRGHFYKEVRNKVKKADRLYILGDFVGHTKDIHKFRTHLGSIQCILIRGNHDPSVAKCKAAFGKCNVFDTLMVKVCGVPTWLSHYAHAYWPKSHRGSYHLYGHTHDQREETLDCAFPDRQSTDVSPETCFRLFGHWGPVSEEELHTYFRQFSGHDDVRFYIGNRGELK
jgi:calcineurin-like phosphoesterase family protein